MIGILFIGDISGPIGRKAVEDYLPKLKKKYDIDFVIANGENVTHGRGLSITHYNKLISCGINCITMGNHYCGVFDVLTQNDRYEEMIRPLNFHPGLAGKGSKTYKVKGKTISVVNLIGVSEMASLGQNNPFLIMDQWLKDNKSDITIVDFHAEATGEKAAFARCFDGKIAALIGTHTHVQTNDARILPKGTALLTDVGACCAFESILGMEPESVIRRNIIGEPSKFIVPKEGKYQFNACYLSVDETTNKVLEIKTINYNE